MDLFFRIFSFWCLGDLSPNFRFLLTDCILLIRILKSTSSLMDKMRSVHPVPVHRLTVHRLLLHKVLQSPAWREFCHCLHHKYFRMSGDIYRYVNSVQFVEDPGCTRSGKVWIAEPSTPSHSQSFEKDTPLNINCLM